MFYLWIGIGGALGSIARAWLALATARITGPQFPWGTILINILGSFVIGFFGTLTTNDSRFAVPTDVRAFVMVGICGGFTTFSSFSLQTLELARDGRLAQAAGNITLSVVLCLVAVAGGHASAAALNRPRASTAMIGSPTMGEVIVAILNRPDEAKVLLDAGNRLLRIGGGGRLRALAVRMPPAATILPSEEVLTDSRAAAIRAEQEDWSGQLHAIVTDWTDGAQPDGIRTDWVDVEGDAAEVVADHGKRADAIVIARPGDHESERAHTCLHAALFDTGTPVLVVPPGFAGSLGQQVAIAWNADARAMLAVQAAIPLLSRARKVHVLRADAAAELPLILEEHGIAATLHTVPDGEGSTGNRILHAAYQLDADLLVMGAFAHGEWRERMFGGVTRTMLRQAHLPLLMRH
jgi:protein CrcB